MRLRHNLRSSFFSRFHFHLITNLRHPQLTQNAEKIGRLDAEMQKRLKEIEELKTQLDELADAQRMVEELTEKNLNLEEYMDEQKVPLISSAFPHINLNRCYTTEH